MVWTLLHSLAGDDDVQEIDALLKTGVDIEEKDLAGLTALHVASGEGSSNAVRVLCDNGANVNAAASYSHVSPLHRAVEEGHEECAGVLIELKADLEARTKEGFTPLHEAVRSGSMALVRLLLESQACVNSTCNTRSSPLHISILNEHHEISTFLVSQGADVYAPDDYGISACDQSGSEEQMRAIGIWKQNVILEEVIQSFM
uniref:Uncharacterized protein n=1 Tax=Guillardia theta TaxID=55529 RepID=A0A6U5X6L5_GUITH|mmetsp:Transcript_17028/g.56331  ORF Transcript_17028/g.56331 Transcript_17028/m.56331 type:complete len:202 (+) Transcript_17028:247-852(+)